MTSLCYAVWFGRMSSPLGSNVLQCSLRYGFKVSCLMSVNCQIIDGFYWKSISSIDVDKERVLLELLFICSGMFRYTVAGPWAAEPIWQGW